MEGYVFFKKKTLYKWYVLGKKPYLCHRRQLTIFDIFAHEST